MTLLPRSVPTLILSAFCAASVYAQQSVAVNSPDPAVASDSSSSQYSMNAVAGNAVSGSSGVRPPVAPEISGGPWLFHHYGVGTYDGPLGFGGRIAVSLASSLNLRAGASYFSFTMDRTVSNIPFTANIRLQSEQATLDWYPFHGSFHVSPGVLFGNSNRVFGGATVPAGNSFTLNNVTYYSGAASPIQASGLIEFQHTAPTLTAGWGNWIRHPEERRQQSHWAFPFEAGVAFTGDPKTALNYSGVVCSSPSQQYCQNIAADTSAQANVQAERQKLQNDANWARFYPLISGGIVYRF
jgi:hypothetical protein